MDIVSENVYDRLDESGRPYRLKKIEEMSASGIRGRETMIYPILGVVPEDGKQWKLGKETVVGYENRGDLLLVKGKPFFRCRPNDEESSMAPFWSLFGKEIGTAESAKTALHKLMGDCGFETIKPVALIQKLIMHTCGDDNEALVLDFFAGSSTTADAAMRYSQAANKQIHSISVQLPEPCKEESQTFSAGYATLCQLGEERIRRAGDEIKDDVERPTNGSSSTRSPRPFPTSASACSCWTTRASRSLSLASSCLTL